MQSLSLYFNPCSANQWTGFYMITASVLKGSREQITTFIFAIWNLKINDVCGIYTYDSIFSGKP